MGELVVVGAGGFGREVVDVVRAINAAGQDSWDLVGVVDDRPSPQNMERLTRLEVAYLGSREALAGLRPDVRVAIGVGSPSARCSIAAQLADLGLRSPELIHPTAVVGSSSSRGEGLIACAGASIGTNVGLGRHVHLNPHTVIGHDTVLGDFVSVNPNATVSGECQIGRGVLVGAGAVVLQGLVVGDEVLVGAAACVVADSSQGEVLVGVPARPLQKGRDA